MNILFRKMTLALLFLLALHLGAAPVRAAAPKADLWSRWQMNDPSSQIRIDHSPWADFLKKFLIAGKDGITRVAYAKVKGESRRRLDAYIGELSAAPVSRLRRAEQFAYWVNLYNALTIKVILDHYPVASILRINISPGWFAFGPWDKKLIVIEGEKVSLNDIEHRILRPIWRDPRIHYAVNCASVGCPNVAPIPWEAERLEAMLDKAARDYINHPRGAHFGRWGLIVSSIFEWYAVDFGGSDAAVIQHLRKFASQALAEHLERAEEIFNHEYNWALNDAPSEAISGKAN
jgi:hypothetical protein